MIKEIKQALDQYEHDQNNSEMVSLRDLEASYDQVKRNGPEWLRYLTSEVERKERKIETYDFNYQRALRQVEELRNALEEIKTMETASWSVSIRAIAALERSKSQ